MNDDAFPRRVLLCTTGMSPQIVTETLFALAVRPPSGKAAWIPTEIRLVTTAAGAEHARLNLLSAKPGWFRQLCADYRLPPIRFTAECIHIIVDAHEKPLLDIRTPRDNEAAADQIAELLREIANDADAQVHVSLAGGRKTMGYYLGYALSLYGRSQDRLSHVLVSEPYEALPDFYYPTPYERVIHTREPSPRAVDCSDAIVDLAEIPFVRLREGLPERLLQGRSRFTESVDAANRAQEPAHVRISTQRRSLSVNGAVVTLNAPAFALYLWMARRALGNEPEVDWKDRAEAKEFLELAKSLYGDLSGEYENIANALKWYVEHKDADEPTKYFGPLRSRNITCATRNALGPSLSKKCEIQCVGPRGRSRYTLPSDLDIEID